MHPPRNTTGKPREPLWPSLLLAFFAVTLLTLLVVVERKDWLTLRLTGATAAAFSYSPTVDRHSHADR